MDEDGPEGLARAYVALGLRLGRVVPGLVDAHVGDPGTARRIAAEPPPDPDVLRRDAAALRRRLGPALGGSRAEYLDAQLGACEVIAARAAGEEVGVVEEIRDCLGVVVGPGEPDAYRAAHLRLAEVLGTSVRRLPRVLAAFRRRDRVAPEHLHPGLAAMTTALRDRTRETVGLPAGERVDLEIVTGVPWAGFAHRVAPGRSVVQVSRDAGHRRAHLPLLAAHEAYPGHHTETTRIELAASPAPERTLFLARTPQSLVAEGAAECGLEAVVGPGWGTWAAGHLAGAGVPTTAGEGALGEAVEDAMIPLAAVRQDATLLLHGSLAVDREEQARAHLRRWLLIDDERAARMLEFLGHPRWRIHTTTYVEGAALVRRWLAARPEGEAAGSRFARLLDEPWTPDRLRRGSVTGSTFSDTYRDDASPRDERLPPAVEGSPASPTVRTTS